MKNATFAAFRIYGTQTFYNFHRTLKPLCAAALIMCLTISACDYRKVDAATEITGKKESKMESIQATTTIQNKIPPIDAAVPAIIETATFAMG